MLFGGNDPVSTQEFIRLILGIDQQQTLSMLQGLLYHTLFLDAFAGRDETLTVLHDLILAFGLIGFTLLALNRAWWTVQIVVSWLVLTLFLVLGARGDVLYTPLDQDRKALVTSLESLSEIVTGLDTAADSARFMAGAIGDNSGISVISGALGIPNVEFPTVGTMLERSIKDQYTQLNVIGGFTPMVYTLYVFNTVKYQLLKGLTKDINVDILRRSGIANQVGAGKLYPATQYFLNAFTRQCSEGALGRAMLQQKLIYDNPTRVGNLPLINENKTLHDALKERKLTFGGIRQMQQDYFNDYIVTPDQRNYVGMPVMVMEKTFLQKILNTGALGWAYFAYEETAAKSETLSMLSEARKSSLGKTPTAAFTSKKALIEATAPPSAEDMTQTGSVVVGLYSIAAYKQNEGDTQSDSAAQVVKADNCWDLFTKFNEHLIEQFGIDEVTARVSKQAFEASLKGGGVNSDGVLVLSPGNGDAQQNADTTLLSAHTKCAQACGTATCPANLDTAKIEIKTAGDAVLANYGIVKPTSNGCVEAQRTVLNTTSAAQRAAIDAGMGTVAAADEYYRDASKQFTGTIRKYGVTFGEKLGELVLWFFALFGGFAAGAYGAIIPSFMNFALMMIFAISPFMFMMGVLMPGWAPQIIITPIAVVAYLKIVEIMFVIVGVIFSALKVGLTNAGLIDSQSVFGTILEGGDTFDSLYNIMVGMAYTSMFAVAGFMLSGVRSPERLLGALAAQGDKTGQISGGEVGKTLLAAGAIYTTAQKGLSNAKGLVSGGTSAVTEAGAQIKQNGLLKGAGNMVTAGFGSFTQEHQEKRIAIRNKIDKVDETKEKFLGSTEAMQAGEYSDAFRGLERQRARRVEAGKRFASAFVSAGGDKRNTQEPELVKDGTTYKGPPGADQLVGQLRDVYQKSDGLAVEAAERKAQDTIVRAQLAAKAAEAKELQENSGASVEKREAIRSKHSLLDTTTDVANKKSYASINMNNKVLKQAMNETSARREAFASSRLSQANEDGRTTLEADLKATGAARGLRRDNSSGNAGTGSGNTGGKRDGNNGDNNNGNA